MYKGCLLRWKLKYQTTLKESSYPCGRGISTKLKWQRKGYNISELDKVYTGNDIRVNNILTSLNKYIKDINEVVGLGFCVSKEHAKFMALRFNEAGIP